MSGDALASALKAASGDIVNTSDVMLAAARGLTEGFQPEQLVALMETARQTAKLTGKDVVTAFNEMTIAIANQQVKALKGLGITIDVTRVMDEYAASVGKARNQLTEADERLAFFNAVMAKAAPTVAALTTAQRTQSETLQRLSGQWKQIQEDIGKFLVDEGFGVLEWAQRIVGSLSDVSSTLGPMGKAWASAWTNAKVAIEPVATILAGTILPILKGLQVAAVAAATAIAGAFSVIVGPLAFMQSVLEDTAKGAWPNFAKAAEAANKATLAAREEFWKSGEALRDTIEWLDTTTKATKRLADAEAGLFTTTKALGKNTLGANVKNPITQAMLDALDAYRHKLAEMELAGDPLALTLLRIGREAEKLKRFFPEAAKEIDATTAKMVNLAKIDAGAKAFDALAKSMRALSDSAAVGQLTEFEEKVEDLARPILDSVAAMTSLSPELRAFYEEWARNVARTTLALEGQNALIKEQAGFVNASVDAVTADLVDEAEAWADVAKAMHDATLIADITGDTTGGVSEKISALEGILAKVSARFGTTSKEAEAFRKRLQDLKHEAAAQVAFTFTVAASEIPDMDTQALLDAADIWSRLGAAIHSAQMETLATGDAVGAAQAKMNAAGAAVADAAKRFGESSEQVKALRERFAELRDEFSKAGLAEALTRIKLETELASTSFNWLAEQLQATEATMAATKAAIMALVEQGLDPSDEAVQRLIASFKELQVTQKQQTDDLKLYTDLTDVVKSETLQLSDAIIDMAASGKASWSDLATSIVKDIAKIIQKMLILKAIEMGIQALGGSGAGAGDGAVQLSGPGAATGAIVKARAGGQLFRVGEGGQDEAIIPLTPAMRRLGLDRMVEVIKAVATPTLKGNEEAAALPKLAKGGIIKARPGGQVVVVGEAGQDEAVIPLTPTMSKLGVAGIDRVIERLAKDVRPTVSPLHDADAAAALPRLALGGVVKARPGGRPVIAGEAGQDEAVIPLGPTLRALGRGSAAAVRGVIDGGKRALQRIIAPFRSPESGPDRKRGVPERPDLGAITGARPYGDIGAATTARPLAKVAGRMARLPMSSPGTPGDATGMKSHEISRDLMPPARLDNGNASVQRLVKRLLPPLREDIGGSEAMALPMLAKGGVVKARPGGRLILAGEAGQDEAIIPLRAGIGASMGVPAGGADSVRALRELETTISAVTRSVVGFGRSVDAVDVPSGAPPMTLARAQYDAFEGSRVPRRDRETGGEATQPKAAGGPAGADVASRPPVEIHIENRMEGAKIERQSSTGGDGRQIERFIVSAWKGAASRGEFDPDLARFGATRQGTPR